MPKGMTIHGVVKIRGSHLALRGGRPRFGLTTNFYCRLSCSCPINRLSPLNTTCGCMVTPSHLGTRGEEAAVSHAEHRNVQTTRKNVPGCHCFNFAFPALQCNGEGGNLQMCMEPTGKLAEGSVLQSIRLQRSPSPRSPSNPPTVCPTPSDSGVRQ